MTKGSDVYVSLEFTPNPNTLKYSVNRELISKGAANFLSLEGLASVRLWRGVFSGSLESRA